VPTREGAEEPLSRYRRLDPAHDPFAQARRLVGLLHAGVAPHRGAHPQVLDTDQLGHPREGRRVTA
jgi:hypothetical protein